MSKRPILFFLIAACIMNLSCATLKPDKFVDGQVRVTAGNLNLLEGKYSRSAVVEPEKGKSDLFWNFYAKGYNVGPDNLCSVTLEIINQDHLKVTLYKNDSIIKAKTLKGKVRNGYFEMNRRVLIIPVLFMNLVRTSKFRIGLLKEGDITTDYKDVSWGTVYFIIPFLERRKEIDAEYPKEID